jgi:putative aminopeptidase FrvX
MATSLRPEAVETLRLLTTTPGLAGHEHKVARHMRREMESYADSVRMDTLGNVISTLKGTDERAPSVMLFAHMDSLGFVVRKVEEDGFIRLERLGGIPEKVLPGLAVTITTTDEEMVPGVIGMKAHHVTPAEEKYKVVPYRELFVDIGASTRGEVEALGILPGCAVTYEGRFQRLLGDRVTATFLDNRSGCVVVLEVLRRLAGQRPKATVHVVGSVQEEYNLRGAMTAAYALQPSMAVCVDGCVSADTPDLRDLSNVHMGEGPTLGLYSFHGRGTLNGLLPHPALVRALTSVARREQIPLQRNVTMGGLTDASYVQLVREGIPAVDVGFPKRYAHAPIETCQLSDMQLLIDLLTVFLSDVDQGFDFNRS